jgi:uncharacterized protein (TIGR03435 family)
MICRPFARSLTPALLVPLSCGAVFAQSTAAVPRFEASEIHSSPHVTFPFMNGGNLHGDRYPLRQATMAEMIATAYSLDSGNVQGGPSWLEMDRFEVNAKASPTTSNDDLKLMLRSLLSDRFHLVVHNGSAPLPAFVLAAGKEKPKMKAASGTGDPGCEGQPPPPNQPAGAIPSILVTCRNITMDRFVEELRDMAGGYLNLPVVNSTGLAGSWDFDLRWTPRGALDRAGADGVSIFDAVDHELGLSLTRQTAPRPVLIVDSVDESPTPNAADIEKQLPPLPPAQFEVAVVKPAKADAQLTGRIRGGQVDVHGVNLRFAINFAWDLNPNDNQLIVGAPPWLDSDRFDILAKISSNGPDDAASRSSDIDQEELRQMLQALLIDRFKMKIHTEDRPINTYTLTSVTPKLTKADPTTRTHCIEGPGPDGKDPRIATPVLNRLITCQNITMPQLADQFRMIAGGYIYGSILDETGLKGSWNFTLSFSSVDRVQGAGGAGPGGPGTTAPAADSAASDPNGALSLFDAVKRQLGLKLEKVRRPVPVLVIDHIDEHPTEN